MIIAIARPRRITLCYRMAALPPDDEDDVDDNTRIVHRHSENALLMDRINELHTQTVDN